jgi:hypothetical protein
VRLARRHLEVGGTESDDRAEVLREIGDAKERGGGSAAPSILRLSYLHAFNWAIEYVVSPLSCSVSL